MRIEKIPVHQFLKRTRVTQEHHLTPSSRGGESITSNLLDIELYRHVAWHYLFQNMTLDEIINYLNSIGTIDILYKKPYGKNAVNLLFHDMTLSEIVFCLKRIGVSKYFQKVKYRL